MFATPTLIFHWLRQVTYICQSLTGWRCKNYSSREKDISMWGSKYFEEYQNLPWKWPFCLPVKDFFYSVTTVINVTITCWNDIYLCIFIDIYISLLITQFIEYFFYFPHNFRQKHYYFFLLQHNETPLSLVSNIYFIYLWALTCSFRKKHKTSIDGVFKALQAVTNPFRKAHCSVLKPLPHCGLVFCHHLTLNINVW